MTRRTSIEAYHRIESEGLLSKRRFQVYSLLFHHGPLTSTGIHSHLGTTGSIENENIRARLTEMRAMGCVDEVGTEVCPITGMEVILWDVTENLPRKLEKGPKEPTKVELLQAACKLLDRAMHGTGHPVTKAKDWVKWREDTTNTLQACAKYRKGKS